MENAKKIRPDEVVILSAGEQIRRKVLGTGKTIEDFAREINFYPVSVKQYLRRHDGGSSSFKVKLTQYFQQGYNEIVRNPEAQLAEKCAQLSENIHLYTEEGDAEVIAHLTRLVEEQGLAAQLPWMQRNLALNRFYQNRVSEALALLFTAEAAVKTGRDVLARATFSADLALIHYYLCEYEPAADWIQEAEQALERLTEPGDKLRFLVAFRRGVISARQNDSRAAVDSFRRALQFAHEDTFIGIGNLHLAEAQYRSGRLQGAKDAYRLALTALESDPFRQSFVYSSYAAMLLAEGDIQRAAYFSEKAMGLCKGEHYLCSFQHFETYARIRVRMGASQQACETLIMMIERNSSEFVYRNEILDALRILLDCFDQVGLDLTQRVEGAIQSLLSSAAEEEQSYVRELKELLAELASRKRAPAQISG